MRTLLSLFVLLICAQTQAPPRDASSSAATPTGTGVIRGRVVATDTGVPIRRALVTISGGPGPRFIDLTIYTDAQGRYEVRNLAAGPYFLRANPNRYQGQFLPSEIPPPSPSGDLPRLTLAEGQTIQDYDLMLPRAGIIVGRLVDENGDPVSNVQVSAFAVSGGSGSVGGYSLQSSDEQGRYRLFRLPPGEFHIVARPSGGGDWTRQGQSLGFLETYYPGTHSRAEAGRVLVRAGQETAAADFVLTRERMFRVNGRVLNSKGSAPSVRTILTVVSRDSSTGTRIDEGTGRFSSEPLPPGTYRLAARLPDENPEIVVEYGVVRVTLTDQDIDDVVVSMKPTVDVAGRIVFEGSQIPTLFTDSLSIGADGLRARPYLSFFIRPVPVARDLTFTLRHIGGELLLRPSGNILRTWMLKGVFLGDQEITDTPKEFRQEDSGRLRIVLTTGGSEISGIVTDDKGRPPAYSSVVLFGEDKATWFASSIRFRQAFLGHEGRFTFKGLRPGRYYAIALPRDRWQNNLAADTADFESLAREATQVVLGEDEQRVVDLKFAAGGGGH